MPAPPASSSNTASPAQYVELRVPTFFHAWESTLVAGADYVRLSALPGYIAPDPAVGLPKDRQIIAITIINRSTTETIAINGDLATGVIAGLPIFPTGREDRTTARLDALQIRTEGADALVAFMLAAYDR